MNKIASKLMIGALALAVFAPTAAFAATNTNVDETKVEQSSHKKYGFFSFEDRQSNQEELMKIINKYNPDLADDFQKLFEEVKAVKVEVDEAAKKKLDEINEQVKNGTLTQEQANEKRNVILSEVKFTTVELDEAAKKELEETKKKLDEINEQVKNGTLTQEQANKKFEELGVFSTSASTLEEVAVSVKVDEAMVKKLDEIDEQVKNGTLTQEQAKEKRNVIIDEAKVEVDEATKKEFEEMKKKLDEINEQVKNGTLTQEQANEKFEELGVVFEEAEVEVDEATKEKLDIIKQIKVAADEDDADTVNKLLQELLEKMQNKKHPEAKAE
ncbi:hypothetical protein JNUCC42_00230 [Brevibacterium sp. JNUCC-42]|nr:hypothetical protein JNUCC42_00230 [Brevibacterium sp. JNUCC-42]